MSFRPPTDDAPATQALWVLAITTTIQALAAAAVLAVPVLAPVLGPELSLPPSTIAGWAAAAVYLGAIIASMLSGAAVRRLGAIRVSQLALLLSACGAACCTIRALPALLLGAFLIGCGYGPITPSSSHVLARTTPRRHMSLVFSIKQTGVPLGGLLAGAILPGLALSLGWRAALWCTALACVLTALCSEPTRRTLDDDRDPTFRLHGSELIRPIGVVLGAPTLRMLAFSSMLFAFVQLAFSAYLVTFLHEGLGMSLVRAGFVMAIAQVGGAIGRILWGWVSDAGLGPRSTLTVLAAVMAGSGIATGMLTGDTPGAVLICVLFVFGASAVGWNGVYLAAVARIAGPSSAGMATAGTLAFTFCGSVVGPPLFGALADALGSFGAAYAALAVPLAAAGVVIHRTLKIERSPQDAAH